MSGPLLMLDTFPVLLGALREKPVRIGEKLSKAKPRDIKGVVCRGLPWSLFTLRFSSKLLDPARIANRVITWQSP